MACGRLGGAPDRELVGWLEWMLSGLDVQTGSSQG